jgi:hypothetical protein
MKRAILFALLIGSLSLLTAGIHGGKAMLYSDSYMMRAKGTEANYWNPALLNEKYGDIWLPVVNSGFYINNNAIDLDTYNRIMRKGTINEADKEAILDMIDGSIRVNTEGQASIFGFTMGNVAISSSANFYAKAALDEDYLRLLLYGNQEESYYFDKKDNNASLLSYADLTVGLGGYRLPLPETVPDITVGLSASLLIGIEDIHTRHYSGYFTSSIDGMSLEQDLTLRTGGVGIGFKSLLGMASEPVKNLKVGITLDNVFGIIAWGLVREDRNYHVVADSVYVADFNEDFYEYTHTEENNGGFSTKLPPELRLGALYSMKHASFSMDYVVGFGNSAQTSKLGRISIGAELLPVPVLPVHIGFSPGSAAYPWRLSYGFGIRIKPIEFGLGMQSFETVFPGTKTKGLAVASYFTLPF